MRSTIWKDWVSNVAEYKAKLARLFAAYGWKGVLSALLGGFTFATILFLPVFIAAFEIGALYLHLITLVSAVIWALAELYVFVFAKLVKQALLLKTKDSGVDHDFLFTVHWVVVSALVVVAGLVYFIWLMPMWF